MVGGFPQARMWGQLLQEGWETSSLSSSPCSERSQDCISCSTTPKRGRGVCSLEDKKRFATSSPNPLWVQLQYKISSTVPGNGCIKKSNVWAIPISNFPVIVFKNPKDADGLNFNIFYLTPHILTPHINILTYNQYKEWDMFWYFFLNTKDCAIWSVFILNSTHPFGPATFQVLTSHMWLVATQLDMESSTKKPSIAWYPAGALIHRKSIVS